MKFFYSILILVTIFLNDHQKSFAQEIVKVGLSSKKIDAPKDIFHDEHIDKFNSRLENSKSTTDLNSLYYEVTSHWRQMVFSSYQEIIDIIKDRNTWKVSFDKKSEAGSAHIEQYKNLLHHFKNYQKTSDIRAETFHKLRSYPHSKSIYSFINITDLNAEVFSVPAKVLGHVSTRVLSLREKAKEGFFGIIRIVYEIFILFIIMILPIIAIKISKKMKSKKKKQRYSLRSRLNQNNKFNLKSANSMIQKNSFWIMALICAFFIETLIKGTSFREFSIFIKLFYLFAFVRFIRFCFMYVLKTVLRYLDFNSVSNKKNLESSGSFVTSYFSIVICLMYLFYAVTGGTVVYTLISVAFKFLTIFLCVAIATSWSKQIGEACLKTISEPLGPILSKGCNGIFSFIYALPCFIILFSTFIYRKIVFHLKKNQLAKGLFAKLIRKKIESKISETRRQNLKSDHPYILTITGKQVAKKENIQPISQVLTDRIKQEIKEWETEVSDEHNFALVGEAGIGKTTYANYLKNTIELDTLLISLPRQLYTPKKIKELVEEAVVPWLEEEQKKSDKKVIIVDDLQNIFISMLGGFNSYLEFMKTMNEKYPNFYWICFFNKSSWHYLEGVFDRNIYFSDVEHLPSWDEEMIRKLVLNNKEEENYKLSFKSIAAATQASVDRASLELAKQQYFELLWEQSKGNPRVASALWKSSLFQGFQNIIDVRLPPEQKTEVLSLFKDESHFIFSEIIRHKSLSRSEIVISTNIPLGVVSNCLKLALNHKIIERSSKGRYRISALWQIDTIQYLKSRNFIYGNA